MWKKYPICQINYIFFSNNILSFGVIEVELIGEHWSSGFVRCVPLKHQISPCGYRHTAVSYNF